MKQCPTELINAALASQSDDITANYVVRIMKESPRIVFGAVLKLINSPSARNRYVGVWILGEMGYPRRPFRSQRLMILKRMAFSDTVEKVRVRAILSLGQMRLRPVAGLLCRLLSSSSKRIRLAAIQSVGYSGSKCCMRVLERCAKDESSEVREWAGFQAGQQKKVPRFRMNALLSRLLIDSDKRVRLEAIRAGLWHRRFSVMPQLFVEMNGFRRTRALKHAANDLCRRVEERETNEYLLPAIGELCWQIGVCLS